MRRFRLLTIALLIAAFAFSAVSLGAIPITGSSTVKFNDNPDHSALVKGKVVGNAFVVNFADGSLPANTSYDSWCFYTIQIGTGKQATYFGNSVHTTATSSAAGGVTVSTDLSTLTNGLPYPGTGECDLMTPDGYSFYGQNAKLSDGFDAYIYGKLKEAP